MTHAVVHFEIGGGDGGSLVRFYAGVFGWTLQHAAGTDRAMIDTRGGGINGAVGTSLAGRPWSSFCVATDDPQATLDKANSLGATTIMPVTDLDGSSMAVFQDLDGLP